MENENRRIKVTGNGALRVAPDTIIVSFAISSKGKTYAEMQHAAERDLKAMQQVAKSAGFSVKELRTVNYSIREIYDYKENMRGKSQRVFAGYECAHHLLLKFPLDISKLHAVLHGAELSKVKPEFGIEFVLRNAAAAKEEALKRAAQDAKRKAELLIAASSDAKLGGILSIEEIGYSHRTSSVVTTSSAGEISDETMRPDSIFVDASAVFVWQIE